MILATHGAIASSSVPFVGLLDTYSGSIGAYSLRKLRAAYSGYAVRVRRSSDNTSQDISFNSLGNLDTTSLTSFVGANDGYVSVWYDQSGNGYDFTQTTSDLQPKLVSSGNIVTGVSGGKPSMLYNASGFKNLTNLIKSSHSMFITLMNNADFPTALVSQWQAGVTNRMVYNLNQNSASSTAANKLNFFIDGTTNGAGSFDLMLEGNISNTSFNLVTSQASTGSENFKTYINSNLNDSATITGVASSIPTAIGYQDQSGGPTLRAYMSELIIYNSNQSSNRTGIESNINNYYSIY